ncbi:MAG: NAD(+) diphosphatase [Gammaproteobacteria bacterium]|nr:NAD(+) diphosphatase [Gammaproteobacteria bacterium]
MQELRPNFFAGEYIDRRSEARDDEAWVEAARADPATRYLIGQGSRQLLEAATPRIAFLDNEAPLVKASDPAQWVLLGAQGSRRVVFIDLPATAELTLPADTQLEELRPLAPVLDPEEAGLLAYARALGGWRARQRHCGACGAATVPLQAGHCLVCSNPDCGQEFYPRLDPAIIVLVSDGERALLGRQASWPARRYSTVAGFVEPGESLEDAVRREVREETGVAVHDVRYHSSQPWPFPASLMLGFRARAVPRAAVRLGGELEDARWFSRADIEGGAALVPPSQSISWRLIESWLKGAD